MRDLVWGLRLDRDLACTSPGCDHCTDGRNRRLQDHTTGWTVEQNCAPESIRLSWTCKVGQRFSKCTSVTACSINIPRAPAANRFLCRKFLATCQGLLGVSGLLAKSSDQAGL